MARFIIKAGFVEMNGVDVTDHITSVAVNMGAAEVPTTNLASVGSERIQGLRSDGFEFNMQQDYAATETDATLNGLFENGTEFPIKVRASAAAVGATNPEYRGNGIILEYPPLSGEVGALATVAVAIPVNGKITRNIT